LEQVNAERAELERQSTSVSMLEFFSSCKPKKTLKEKKIRKQKKPVTAVTLPAKSVSKSSAPVLQKRTPLRKQKISVTTITPPAISVSKSSAPVSQKRTPPAHVDILSLTRRPMKDLCIFESIWSFCYDITEDEIDEDSEPEDYYSA